MLCECNCGEELTGKAKRFKNDQHRAKFWTAARRKGAATGHAHFGVVIGNPRLEPLLMAIMGREVMTSAELQAITGSMCIATDMSNIRKFYPQLSEAKYLHTNENGRRVFEYTWNSD
jgi:hypothetical protein